MMKPKLILVAFIAIVTSSCKKDDFFNNNDCNCQIVNYMGLNGFTDNCQSGKNGKERYENTIAFIKKNGDPYNGGFPILICETKK